MIAAIVQNVHHMSLRRGLEGNSFHGTIFSNLPHIDVCVHGFSKKLNHEVVGKKRVLATFAVGNLAKGCFNETGCAGLISNAFKGIVTPH